MRFPHVDLQLDVLFEGPGADLALDKDKFRPSRLNMLHWLSKLHGLYGFLLDWEVGAVLHWLLLDRKGGRRSERRGGRQPH